MRQNASNDISIKKTIRLSEKMALMLSIWITFFIVNIHPITVHKNA